MKVVHEVCMYGMCGIHLVISKLTTQPNDGLSIKMSMYNCRGETIVIECWVGDIYKDRELRQISFHPMSRVIEIHHLLSTEILG